jgi:hypothetical protein
MARRATAMTTAPRCANVCCLAPNPDDALDEDTFPDSPFHSSCRSIRIGGRRDQGIERRGAAAWNGGFGNFHTPLWQGLTGILVSPSRGLFVYTPIMLFAAIGAGRVWRVESPPWLRFLVVGVALHMLLYAKFDS